MATIVQEPDLEINQDIDVNMSTLVITAMASLTTQESEPWFNVSSKGQIHPQQ